MEFKFPDVGEGISEGEIVKWLVKEGDMVKADQVVVQIETDKAVVDIPVPISGKILKLNYKEGDTVQVGASLLEIGGEKDKVSPAKPSKETKEPPQKAKIEEKVTTEKKLHSETMRSSDAVLAMPSVRKKAVELGIDLTKVKGTGAGGSVTLKDLNSSANTPEEKENHPPQQTISVKRKYDEFGYVERVPLKGIRKTIAQNMVRSLSEAAQVTSMEDIDVTKLWELRNKEKVAMEKQGIKLTFLPFIIKAIIAALKENPILNSSLESDEIIIKKYFNIGVATETDVGLMVPVIKIADSKTIPKLAKEIEELADKARKRTIDIMDLKGGTFTITNYGSVGGTYGTPVINPGEAAIIGLGRIFDRVVPQGLRIKTIKVLPVSLTFDHRILDGAQAARFLESLKSYLEEPDHLLLDMK